jgi:salicylate hydroxylase
MADGLPILIAGAGIAGLATALALARGGHRSILIERRTALSEAGAGIQIGPNGMRILKALGVDRALEPLASKPRSIVIAAGITGRILAELPLGQFMIERYGAPYWVAHRADLQNVLLNAVQAMPGELIEMRTGQEVSRWRDADDGLTVELANGDTIEGGMLIGADGLWSSVRRRMFPADELVYAGKLAARCVIPSTYAEGRIAATKTGVWLGPDAHVVHYPVRDGAEIAVVAIIDEVAERPRRWGNDIDARQVLDRVSAFAHELRAFLSRGQGWQAWSLYDPPPLPTWVTGRAVLIGDAAHPILPFLAQGGVMALEDAWTLAAHLPADPTDRIPALMAFEQNRRERIAKVQRISRANGHIYHLRGIPALARDSALAIVPPSRLMARLDWLYGWRADTPNSDVGT